MTNQEIASARSIVLLYAVRRIGELYLWGAEEEAEGGRDCSGLVCAALSYGARAWPSLYDGQRRTASGLFSYYKGCEVDTFYPGCLAGWRSSRGSIYHVKIILATVPDARFDNALGPGESLLPVGVVAIDAGGGNSRTISPAAALARGASVRFSAGDSHGGQRPSILVDPFMKLANHSPSSLTTGGAVH